MVLCLVMGMTFFTGCGGSKIQEKEAISVDSVREAEDSKTQKNELVSNQNKKDTASRDSVSDRKENQLDYIQAEYKLIDATNNVTDAAHNAGNNDNETEPVGSVSDAVTYINADNYGKYENTDQSICDSREKEDVMERLLAMLCGIAGATDIESAKNEGLFQDAQGQDVMEPVPFIGVPCTDENGNCLDEAAPVFRKIFDGGILNDFFLYKPEYELVDVDGETEKWYQITWSTDAFFEELYAEAYLQDAAGRKAELEDAVKKVNNGSEKVAFIVSPETIARCLDRCNLDLEYGFVFNNADAYQEGFWTYEVIYNGVRYTSTVSNDDVKINVNTNDTSQIVVMEQWYSDLLNDKNLVLK